MLAILVLCSVCMEKARGQLLKNLALGEGYILPSPGAIVGARGSNIGGGGLSAGASSSSSSVFSQTSTFSSSSAPFVFRMGPGQGTESRLTWGRESYEISEVNRIKRRAVTTMRPGVVCRPDTKCCYEDLHVGYVCQDYYELKGAVCKPLVQRKSDCEEDVADGSELNNNPITKHGHVQLDDGIIKMFDDKYTRQWQRLALRGRSRAYFSKDIPVVPFSM